MNVFEKAEQKKNWQEELIKLGKNSRAHKARRASQNLESTVKTLQAL